MSYTHLSPEERYYIEISLKNEIGLAEIAASLERPQSTISREISRNTGRRGYRHKQADRLARERHKEKPKSLKLTNEIKLIIDRYIVQEWSPEQVCGRLKKEEVVDLHHETIYQYILADKRSGADRNRNGIPNRVDIDERPEAANKRERVGDWEVDTIIGKNHKGAIVTLDDRKSKLRLAMPTGGKKARDVTDAVISVFRPLKRFVKTLTFDNGKEFSCHEEISKALNCDAYFAKPYHSWERGQNENANGLLRQYFPKSMELIDVTKKQVLDAVHKLNSRPRKCLGYKTPYEVFEELTGIKQKTLVGYALMT